MLSGTPAGAHVARMKLKGAQVHAGGSRTRPCPQHRLELSLICCGCAFAQAMVTGQKINAYQLHAVVPIGVGLSFASFFSKFAGKKRNRNSRKFRRNLRGYLSKFAHSLDCFEYTHTLALIALNTCIQKYMYTHRLTDI